MIEKNSVTFCPQISCEFKGQGKSQLRFFSGKNSSLCLCQGIAVTPRRDGFTLDAWSLKPSGFCNVGVDRRLDMKKIIIAEDNKLF